MAGNGEKRPRYSPYVEISLDNLRHNAASVRSSLPEGVGIAAVVKDCSYGCGGEVVAKTLENDCGVKFFAVARPCEAAALRESGVKSPILVLGTATEEELLFGADNDILFALNDLGDIDRWKSSGVSVRCHVNIDTGMSRVGLLPREVGALIDAMKTAPNGVCIDGVFTHMACADGPDANSVDRQLHEFTRCVDRLRGAGVSPRHIHYGNSATFMRFPIKGCTLVRPGIALYGCRPDPARDFGVDLKPVASLKSSVVKMKKVPAGTPVSYGWNYVTESETWIATIALGYAHGLPRFISGKGGVLIGGRRYRVAGNVTMDYIMVDAGPNPEISVGDEAVAIGSQGGETITPDDVAVIGNTIGYEIICNLGTSIPRFYVQNGKTVRVDRGAIF